MAAEDKPTNSPPAELPVSLPDSENTEAPGDADADSGVGASSGNACTQTGSDANANYMEKVLEKNQKLSFLGAQPAKGGSATAQKTKEESNRGGSTTDNNETSPEDTPTPVPLLVTEANDDIVPLPQMQRNRTRRPSQRRAPGAYPQGSNNGNDSNYDEENGYVDANHVTDPSRDQAASTIPHAAMENSGLAVASPVDDTEQVQHLPQAEGIDATTAQSRRAKETNWFKMKVLLGVAFFIVIAVVVVAVFVKREKMASNDEVPPTISPSNSPSQAPSPEEDSILSLLPEVTIQAINNASNAPMKAYEWLMEEKEYFPFLADYRIQQRFALATFYFCTNGDQWDDNTNWLHHSIHECLWLSTMDQLYYWNGYPELYPLEHINPCELEQEPTTFMSDGVIQHLWLNTNGLTGDWAPPELYMLTELKSLALAVGSELQPRPIPTTIASLQNLEFIAMYACQLTGPIPSELSDMPNLRVFEVGVNRLTGTIPSEIYSMTQLESFTHVATMLTGPFPTELGLLTNIKRIGSADTLFSGQIPTELGNL